METRPQLAIIGTGVAGLGAAYFLRKDFNITLFERNDYLGGHSNTVDLEEGGAKLPVDTGFIVFNHVTYPHLLKLFNTIKAPTKLSDMSFSVQSLHKKLEFSGTGLNGLFAQRSNLFSPWYIRFLLQINKFNELAPKILDDDKYSNLTLGEFAMQSGFTRDLLDHYLVPMSSAVWSTPPDLMLKFPAVTLARFFYNHGFLGLNTQHQWYTVDGGSREYVKLMIHEIKPKININNPIKSVFQENGKVIILDQSDQKYTFDKVIIATHGDEALNMLRDPSKKQKEYLKEFHYYKNIATLHTDDSLMPKKKLAWSSWNYRTENINGNLVSHTIYWMNRLQGISKKINYFLSINDPGLIDPKKVLRTISYHHPLFSLDAIKVQSKLSELNKEGEIYFCGSYFKYGFHEDAFASGHDVAKIILGRDPWSI
jgi:predicted NAD/FAD-binding protein